VPHCFSTSVLQERVVKLEVGEASSRRKLFRGHADGFIGRRADHNHFHPIARRDENCLLHGWVRNQAAQEFRHLFWSNCQALPNFHWRPVVVDADDQEL
jgi:hypothetical protein